MLRVLDLINWLESEQQKAYKNDRDKKIYSKDKTRSIANQR